MLDLEAARRHAFMPCGMITMQPVEGGGATRPGASVTEGAGTAPERTARSAAARLDTALDRISGALVRRAEREAAGADLERARMAESEQLAEAEPMAAGRAPEVRRRVDVLIKTLRQAIAEHEDRGVGGSQVASE